MVVVVSSSKEAQVFVSAAAKAVMVTFACPSDNCVRKVVSVCQTVVVVSAVAVPLVLARSVTGVARLTTIHACDAYTRREEEATVSLLSSLLPLLPLRIHVTAWATDDAAAPWWAKEHDDDI